MANPETFDGRHESYIVVTDKDGEEYICPKSSVKKTKDMSKEELAKCVPEYTSGGGASVGG